MSLLGLDVGTTGCKAIVFSEEGQILSSAYREYPLVFPRPGWIELDPNLVWQAVEETIKAAVSAAPRKDPVRALAASVQGEAVCPVDSAGNPLANSIVTFDSRTLPQAEQLRQAVGEERVYQVSGQPLHPMGTVLKIAWWRQEQPQVYERAARFVCYGDFVLLKLGLPPVMDESMAARTMGYDIHRHDWCEDILEALRIDREKLPQVAQSGTAIGEIPCRVCEQLGLPRGVLACTGGHDQPCGALGAGAVFPGRAMYAIGTVECLTPALPSFNPSLGRQGFPCYPHVAPGQYVTLGFNFGGGSVLRWFRDNFARAEVERARETGLDPYDLMLQPLDTRPGKLLLLPHFAGTGTPWLDPLAKGAIVGLTLASTSQDILKAILEGTTYEIALNLHRMQEAGVAVHEVRAIGGGTKSSKWLQIKADILGLELSVPAVSEAACLGAAILAGCGARIYDDVASAADRLARPVAHFAPDAVHAARHQERLAIYQKLYPALCEIVHALEA
jgi:xylulokinase